MSKKERTIALPFTIDTYGKVGATEDQSKIWSDRVLSVVGTTLRERLMRPNFGTVIPFSLFDSSDHAQEEIQAEVARAFNSQLTLLSLSGTQVTFDEYTGAISVSITYGLPNSEIVTTNLGLVANIGTVAIAGTTPIYEELL